APDGEAALRALQTRLDVTLLFTDVGLPGRLNGRQLAEEARRRKPGLKVLFTTGYARNAIVHEGRLDPGVQLITKPFTYAALAAKLRDVLDARSPSGRILLVEDEALLQLFAADLLEELGFKVDTAGTATEALNKLRLIPGGVDAAIIDIGLPDRKGDALIPELRALFPSLPVVIASGQDEGALREQVKSETNVSILPKPYTKDQVAAALREIGVIAKRGDAAAGG
ncbi:MAG TPA: response regulator, partial [Roseiarcus sp.]|nr:response regulator [Roseiarcus sp.]